MGSLINVTKAQKIKLSLTSLMSLLSIVLFASDPSPTKFICVFAMISSSLGDIALMDLKLITKHIKNDLLAVGMFFFGIAHILYIVLYIIKSAHADASINIGTCISVGISLLTVALLIVISIKRKSLPFWIVIFGIFYILILSINLCTVSTLAFSLGGSTYVTLIGALAFFISDIIIALSRLLALAGCEIPIWLFYVTGQILLIFGA